VLNSIVSQISEQSLQVKVTGPLENPNISREALPAVNKMLQQIRTEAQEGASAVTAPAAAAVPWVPLQR
jgi:multidrug efflux pump subunit AcrA (membrane-fusion protein)